jgi:hypothetical protein
MSCHRQDISDIGRSVHDDPYGPLVGPLNNNITGTLSRKYNDSSNHIS